MSRFAAVGPLKNWLFNPFISSVMIFSVPAENKASVSIKISFSKLKSNEMINCKHNTNLN